ncbi:MAG TPA: choice-of-anchor P family protein [Mycobacteriales bacterium]|nr:choice-of-anchor P family protein [Mycobacteriales bacterium]
MGISAYPRRLAAVSARLLTALAVLAGASVAMTWDTAAGAGKPQSGGKPAATLTTYSGDAQVVDVDLMLLSPGLSVPITVDLVRAGPLPSSGGMLDDSLLTIDDPSPDELFLTGEVASAATMGGSDEWGSHHSESFASVAAVDLRLGPTTPPTPTTIVISAGLLQARSEATCKDGGVVLAGSSQIANLVVNGTPIVVSGAPNQTVEVPGVASIIINEQTRTPNQITVTALHVVLPSGDDAALGSVLTGDVIISRAESDITCGSNPPEECPVKDFVTGGGWITLPSGEKGTFGFVGGLKSNGLQGHLMYIDHGTGPRVAGTAVTAYSGDGSARTVTYSGTVDGVADSIDLAIADNGEPGGGVDDFALSSAAYSASGPRITKGNIALHKPACPTSTTRSGKGGGKQR